MAKAQRPHSPPEPQPPPDAGAGRDHPASQEPVEARDDLVEVEQRVVKWWHPLAAVLLLVGVFLVFDRAGVGSELRQGDLAEMRDWIEGFGMLAPIVFMGIYILMTLLGSPASPLTFAAGGLFGSVIGLITSIVASNITVLLSFLIARHYLRGHATRWFGQKRRFRQLDALTLKHGGLVVIIVRLANLLPFFVVNYGFGVTRIGFKTYAVGSFLGRLPGTIALVLIGDAVFRSIIEGNVPWLLVSTGLGLLAALALVIRELNRRLRGSDDEEPAPASTHELTRDP